MVYGPEDAELFELLGGSLASGLTSWLCHRNARRAEDSVTSARINMEQQLEQSEASHRLSERRYQELFEQIVDVVYRTDADGVMLEVSPSCERMFGYSPAELRGRRVRELYVDPSRRDAFLAELSSRGRIADFETEIRRKDGSSCWVSTSARMLTTEDGAFDGVHGITRDLSKFKEAEQALLPKNLDLELAQRTANVGNWSLDPEVGIPVWSDEIFRIYERDPRLGPYPLADYPKIYQGESWDIFSSAIARAIDDGAPYDIVLKLHLSSGTTKWVRAICEPEPDRGPAGHCLRGTIQDISAAKKDEELLRQQKYLLEKSQAMGRIGTWELDIINNELRWTDENCRIFGVPEGSVVSYEVFIDKVHPDDRDYVQRAWTAGLAGNPYDIEHRILVGGRTNWVREKAEVTFDADGEALRAIGFTQDITERKEAQQELEKQKTAFESLFQSIPDAILVTDRQRRITNVNQGFTALFGYEPEEVIGKTTSVIYASEEEFQKQGRERYHLDAAQAVAPYVVTYQHKDGTSISGETIGTKVVTPDGEFLGFFGLMRDISERLKQEEFLRESQKMEALGTLSGGIAHDFNNILAAILGFSSLIKERVVEGSQDDEDITEVIGAARRAKELVSQILTFSRQGSESTQPVHMRDLVSEAMRMMRQTIPSTIEIRQDIRADRDVVQADPTQLHQVIMNLCSNAYQAMPDGEGELTVTLATEELDADSAAELAPELSPGTYVRLTVADTGVGMPPEVLTKVCYPFFSTKPPGEGTGMGMAVVHGIVKHHGGALVLDSHPGRGTTVDVYLPHREGEPRSKAVESAAVPRGTERILVVDDELMVAKMADRSLSRLSYREEHTTSSTDALARFRQDPTAFDLVLTDQTMPQMTGDTLAAELMKLRANLPIIICSGYSESMTPERATKLGVKGLLAKPFELASLARAIRDALDD